MLLVRFSGHRQAEIVEQGVPFAVRVASAMAPISIGSRPRSGSQALEAIISEVREKIFV